MAAAPLMYASEKTNSIEKQPLLCPGKQCITLMNNVTDSGPQAHDLYILHVVNPTPPYSKLILRDSYIEILSKR